jgi:predicted metal-dependent hydrolase
MTPFEQKLEYGNSTINYTVIKSGRRRKTLEIIIKKDGKVTVRAPFDKSISDIEGFIQKNAKWILKKQLEYKNETPRQIMNPTYEEGSTLPYLGKNYPLKIVNHQKNKENNCELVNEEEFLVSLSINSRASKRRIKALYEEWLMLKAHPIFQDKVKEYSTQLAVEPSQIIIKNLKSRWGSATKGNVINLNVNLLKASEDVIDYVVLHELCHLKIKEHSHHFWNLAYKFMPNYHEKIKWLKINSASLVS